MLSASFYPNNEVRLRVASKVPSKTKDSIEARRLQRLASLLPSLPSSPPTSGEATSDAVAALLSLDSKINNPKLPLSPSEKRGGGWGHPARKTTFGNNARRKLMRAGGALEKLGYGTSSADDGRVAFFTGTLPGSTDESLRAIAHWSGYISNRLTQWFRNDSVNLWGYVWEWQQRLALHIHVFAASKNKRKLAKMIKQFKNFWYQLLLDVCEKSGVDLFARKEGGTWRFRKKILRAKGEWARKSPAAYLCKYVSKNAAFRKVDDSRFAVIPADFYPARWWGMSSDLKAQTESLSCSYSIETTHSQELDLVADLHFTLEPLSTKIHTYTDKYYPDNINIIFYVEPSLWEDLKCLSVLFSSQSCSLESRPASFKALDISPIKTISSSNLVTQFLRYTSSYDSSIVQLWYEYNYGELLSNDELLYLIKAAKFYLSKFTDDFSILTS